MILGKNGRHETPAEKMGATSLQRYNKLHAILVHRITMLECIKSYLRNTIICVFDALTFELRHVIS